MNPDCGIFVDGTACFHLSGCLYCYRFIFKHINHKILQRGDILLSWPCCAPHDLELGSTRFESHSGLKHYVRPYVQQISANLLFPLPWRFPQMLAEHSLIISACVSPLYFTVKLVNALLRHLRVKVAMHRERFTCRSRHTPSIIDQMKRHLQQCYSYINTQPKSGVGLILHDE